MKKVTKKAWRAMLANPLIRPTLTVSDAATLFGVRNPAAPAGFRLLGWTWEIEHVDGSFGIVTLAYPGEPLGSRFSNFKPDRMRPVFVAEDGPS